MSVIRPDHFVRRQQQGLTSALEKAVLCNLFSHFRFLEQFEEVYILTQNAQNPTRSLKKPNARIGAESMVRCATKNSSRFLDWEGLADAASYPQITYITRISDVFKKRFRSLRFVKLFLTVLGVDFFSSLR